MGKFYQEISWFTPRPLSEYYETQSHNSEEFAVKGIGFCKYFNLKGVRINTDTALTVDDSGEELGYQIVFEFCNKKSLGTFMSGVVYAEGDHELSVTS